MWAALVLQLYEYLKLIFCLVQALDLRIQVFTMYILDLAQVFLRRVGQMLP